MSDFAKEVLQQIADTLGISAEQMAADYNRQFLTPEEREIATWWRTTFADQQRQVEEWHRVVFDRVVTEAMFSAAIELPFDHTVRLIVGHDPQKLLPSPRRWYPLFGDSHMIPSPEVSAEWIRDLISPSFMDDLWPKKIDPNEMIDFDAPVSDLAKALSDTMTAAMPRRRDFVVIGTGRITYPTIPPLPPVHERPDGPEKFKAHFIFDEVDWADIEAAVVSWGDPHSDPLADIQRFSDAVRDKNVKAVYLDIGHPQGGEVPGPFDPFYLKPMAVAPAPNKGYLKHDPTKQHRRRKRK